MASVGFPINSASQTVSGRIGSFIRSAKRVQPKITGLNRINGKSQENAIIITTFLSVLQPLHLAGNFTLQYLSNVIKKTEYCDARQTTKSRSSQRLHTIGPSGHVPTIRYIEKKFMLQMNGMPTCTRMYLWVFIY